MQEEFATPLPARAASADLIHAQEEIEEEGEDMRVPDPPQFSGEAGKDDLNTFTHKLDAWYFSARCVSTLAPASLFQLMKYKAFSYESQAYEWFSVACIEIEAAARAAEADEDAYHTLTIKALRKEFEHLAGDREQELNNIITAWS